MAYPYQFQGGMFGAPQGGYNMRQTMMQRGGYGMRQPMMGGGMNSRGGYLDNRGAYDRMGGAGGNMAYPGGTPGFYGGGLDRGGMGGAMASRQNLQGAWNSFNSSMDGPVGDPSGAFRPPPFYSGGLDQLKPIQSTGGGMFGPVTGGQNIETAPAVQPAGGGFTGIPPWGPNTPSPMPPDGFGGPSQPGAPNTPVTGGPPGSVAPNGQPYTQIDYTNRPQLGTPQGDQQASTNALLGFINQYGRERGLQMYRQMLDNQAMPSNALGGGGELPPINLNRGIRYT